MTTDYDSGILNLLGMMQPITLDEMSSIRLMNRIDTKFVCSKRQLTEMLHLVRRDNRSGDKKRRRNKRRQNLRKTDFQTGKHKKSAAEGEQNPDRISGHHLEDHRCRRHRACPD